MKRSRRARGRLGLLAAAALGAALALALAGSWAPASAAVVVSAAAAWAAGYGVLPWTHHAYVTRLARAWTDWNGAVNAARDDAERARATRAFGSRLRRMRRPPEVAADHARLIEAVDSYPSEASIWTLQDLHARYFGREESPHS